MGSNGQSAIKERRPSREATAGSAARSPDIPCAPHPRVLLLNAGYEALTALTARRAVVMLLCGKADVVHDNPELHVMRSETQEVRVPSVIRLREYVHIPYRAKVPMTRAALMHRDGNRCGYCGVRATTIDHVVPRAKGGRHEWENVVAACRDCNVRKRDRLLHETSMTLLSTPMPPRGFSWISVVVGTVPDDWQEYLGSEPALSA